ncbi:MAG: hypothetical protein QW341_00435 [Candidatus Bathyarchaeia archaeon]
MYGVVKRFVRREDLSDEERRECERMSWKGSIVFSELYRFDPPLLIKETTLSGLRARGKCWHGYPLTEEQVNENLSAAEDLCSVKKI